MKNLNMLFLTRISELSKLEDKFDSKTCYSVNIVKNWIYNFLCKEHINLGRSGKVCPYTKPSIDTNNYWIAAVVINNINFNQLSEFIAKFIDIYEHLEVLNDSTNLLKCVTIIFIGDNITSEIIDYIHQANKILYVNKGLMLGQFYPGCDIAGIRNKKFMPLDSPMPLLVVRQMVKNDYMFLNDDNRYLDAYNRYFNQ
jgi:hypothetical protein